MQSEKATKKQVLCFSLFSIYKVIINFFVIRFIIIYVHVKNGIYKQKFKY